MEDSQRVCRTCLRSENLSPIFTKAEQHERFTVALFLTTGLQVEFNDGLPQTICSECRDFMKVAIDFRTQCHQSERTLLQLGFCRKASDTSHDPTMKDYYLRCFQTIDYKSSANYEKDRRKNRVSTEGAALDNCSVIDHNASTDIKIEFTKIELKDDIDDEQEHVLNFSCDLNESRKKNHNTEQSVYTKLPIELDNQFASFSDQDFSDDNQHGHGTPVKKRRESKRSSFCWSEDSFEMETKVKSKPRERKRAPHLDREKTYGHLVDKPMGLPGPYKCKACKKVLKNWSCFRGHAKVHAGFQFMCELCGKLFSTVTMLKRHNMSQHGAECTYRCRLCGYSTWDTERLKIHERREHTKERPYVCDTCGAGFYDRSNIIHHMVVHLVEKNVQCPRCPSKFKSQQQLMSHNWHVHSKRRVACDICRKSYTCSGNLREHQRKIHGVYVKGRRPAGAEPRRRRPAERGGGPTEWQYVSAPYGQFHVVVPPL